jgi:serine/threonine-protein kinase RsbW
VKEEIAIVLPSHLKYLRFISYVIEKIAQQAGFAGIEIERIKSAVDEACTNVIQHAYEGRNDRHFRINCFMDEWGLKIVVCDQGKFFTPPEIDYSNFGEDLNSRSPGGLGIYLMRAFMDRVEFKRTRGCNEVHMVKYLRGEMQL